MESIASLVYVLLQLIGFPLTILSLMILSYTQLFVSKKLGVSVTAVDPIASRWIMDKFGMRKDSSSVSLYQVIPNGSVTGLWLLLFPAFIRYKLTGKNKGYPSITEEGKESILNGVFTRTVYFDRIIKKWAGKIDQFVVLGAGLDTRCYGALSNAGIGLFELDRLKTQQFKIDHLKKANIEAGMVHFISTDFNDENWIVPLINSPFDPDKRTLFLWEAVTLYLTEEGVKNTIHKLKEHSGKGSVLVTDLYKKNFGPKGVKASNELFIFGLDFSPDKEDALHQFALSTGTKLGEYYFLGYKTKKGTSLAVTELFLNTP